MNRILKEPLLHFLGLGAVIFVAYGFLAKHSVEAPGQIVITPGQIEHLITGFMKTRQRPPTEREMDGLIRERVREEVYCREAMALGLDKDDTVIRRRLRQKMEFVSADIVAQAEPTDAELNAYLQAHPDAFRVERQFTFSQVYLNPERRGENLARDAAQWLAQLNQAGDPRDASAIGDAFPLGHTFAATPRSEVAMQFGEAFAKEFEELAPGPWHGPIASGYGLHLVCIEARTEGRLPELADVHASVRREWDNARRLESNEKFFTELLKRYVVTIERPEAAKEPNKVAVAK